MFQIRSHDHKLRKYLNLKFYYKYLKYIKRCTVLIICRYKQHAHLNPILKFWLIFKTTAKVITVGNVLSLSLLAQQLYVPWIGLNFAVIQRWLLHMSDKSSSGADNNKQTHFHLLSRYIYQVRFMAEICPLSIVVEGVVVIVVVVVNNHICMLFSRTD